MVCRFCWDHARKILSEFLASPDQESETRHCNERAMYEIEAKSSMAGWEVISEGLLSAATEFKGMSSS